MESSLNHSYSHLNPNTNNNSVHKMEDKRHKGNTNKRRTNNKRRNKANRRSSTTKRRTIQHNTRKLRDVHRRLLKSYHHINTNGDSVVNDIGSDRNNNERLKKEKIVKTTAAITILIMLIISFIYTIKTNETSHIKIEETKIETKENTSEQPITIEETVNNILELLSMMVKSKMFWILNGIFAYWAYKRIRRYTI